MLKLLTVRGIEGDLELPLLSNGMTKVNYRRLFGQDLEVAITQAARGETVSADSDLIDSTYIEKLAFTMNMAALGKTIKEISVDDFYKWLEQFEAISISEKAVDVINIYTADKKGTSNLKNAPLPSTVK